MTTRHHKTRDWDLLVLGTGLFMIALTVIVGQLAMIGWFPGDELAVLEVTTQVNAISWAAIVGYSLVRVWNLKKHSR